MHGRLNSNLGNSVEIKNVKLFVIFFKFYVMVD